MRRTKSVTTLAGWLPAIMLVAPGFAFGALDWELKEPETSPPARNSHAMAYDQLRQQVVVFGGRVSNIFSERFSDTWVWDGITWTEKSPSTSPPARWGHTMVYDAAHGQIVLFGGHDGSTTLADTWVWDGTNWTQKFPTLSPSDRVRQGMSYDAKRSQVVLFGGSNASFAQFSDTWVWDGNNWAQKFPSVNPPANTNQVMTFDTARSQVVLFGYGTWVWDGTTWTEKFPPASPPTRDLPSMAYDTANGRVVLFGGGNGSALLNDTWVWDGSTWNKMSPSVSPALVADYRMAYDEVRGQVVLFGGGSDTWVWGDPPSVTVTISSALTSATFSVSGTNCQAGSDYTVPQTFQWLPGSSCTVAFNSPVSGGAGTRSLFTGWSDAVPDNPRTITVPSSATTYTATYKTQYQLNTLVSPSGAGSVTGAGFYDASTSASVVATTTSGYQFIGWTPVLSPNTASSSVSMTAARSITANFALITTLSVTAAAGRYSDPVTLSATVGPPGAVFAGSLQFQVDGVNAGASVPVNGSGVYTTSYAINGKAGRHTITAALTSSTPMALGSMGSNTLTVNREDATITTASGNPATVQVSSAGGTANTITLTGEVQEVPDGNPGDLSKAAVTVSLLPAVSGSPTITCAVSNGAGSLAATCSNVPVNAYTVQWNITGDYYQGPQINRVLAVYDPSLGFVTGSGSVVRNGVSADFSLSVKYNKDGTIGGGGVTWVEHRSTGDVAISSTVLTSMSIVGTTAVIDGQARVNGSGAYPLRVTVTDNGSPGVNRDLFGLQASPAISFSPVAITSGNIQVH